jgi:methionine-rich copper-binding protein CopC
LTKKLALLFFLVLLLAIAVGCSADASADDIRAMSEVYRGEFVNGDPQRRSYIFSGLTGYYRELLTVDASEALSVRLELATGSLTVTVLDPQDNEIVTRTLKPGEAGTVLINGPLEAGTYTLILQGLKADGRVQLLFQK